ncbi:hypothetical protein OAK57_02180 [Synechococcus sp. AH-551-N23]|nr:hypothetical protein [Synechococcus sp. AH-551-N23]
MNNFQKTLLTAALAWVCIVIPNIAWQALGRSLLWDLSYVLPPAFVGPTVLLVAAFWVALFAWAIWRLWKTNG